MSSASSEVIELYSTRDGKPVIQPALPFAPWDCNLVPVPVTPKLEHINDKITPGALCKVCWSLRSQLEDHFNSGSKLDLILKHHDNGHDFRRTVVAGCHLCTLMWDGLIQASRTSESVHGPHPGPDWLANVGGIMVTCSPTSSSSLGGVDARYILEPSVIPNLDYLPISADRRAYTWLYVQFSKYDKVRGIKSGAATFSTATNSLAMMELVKGWISSCAESHPNCSATDNRSAYLPTRLIDIGLDHDNLICRVVETNNASINGAYIALSYCWGGDSPLALTSVTYQELREGVSSARLAETIQGAIQVAKHLAVRYIWVDSLCILQDSLADWTYEATRMGDVYRNCYLTIAASGAANSREGLFSYRNPLIYSPFILFGDLNGLAVQVSPATAALDHLNAFLDDCPLHKRGWVHQERLLSARTLNFGPLVIWECCQSLHDDANTSTGTTRYGGFKDEGYRATKKSMIRHIKSFNSKLRTLDHLETFELLELWEQSVVRPYTNAALTIPTDRLAAIQGILQQIEDDTGWKNIFGLWESSLVEQLLWFTSSRRESMPRVANVAPTWSWASIQSQVEYSVPRNTIHFRAMVEYLTTTSTNVDVLQEQSVIRVHSIMFPLEGINTVGQRGQVRGGPPCTRLLDPSNHDNKVDETKVMMDTSPVPAGPYYFIPLIGADGVDNEYAFLPAYISGIAVTKSKTFPEVYERVGFVQHCLEPGHAIDEMDPERVSIVII